MYNWCRVQLCLIIKPSKSLSKFQNRCSLKFRSRRRNSKFSRTSGDIRFKYFVVLLNLLVRWNPLSMSRPNSPNPFTATPPPPLPIRAPDDQLALHRLANAARALSCIFSTLDRLLEPRFLCGSTLEAEYATATNRTNLSHDVSAANWVSALGLDSIHLRIDSSAVETDDENSAIDCCARGAVYCICAGSSCYFRSTRSPGAGACQCLKCILVHN